MGGGNNEITISAILDTVGFQKGTKQLQRAIGGITNSVKRMAASIIGAASVYGVLSKAVSTYMSQNEQLTAQMNAIWTALGNAIGPIINQIISWVSTAVSYFIEFLRLLGVVSKTASQLSKSAKKAGQELKTIAGFDELNVLTKPGGSPEGRLEDKEAPAWVQDIVDFIKQGKWEDAGKKLAEKFNETIAKIKWREIGKKIGYYLGGAISMAASFVREASWNDLGLSFGELFMGVTDEIDPRALGELIVAKLRIMLGIVTGFLATPGLGERVAGFLSGIFVGALNSLTEEIENADWRQIGKNIREFFEKLWEDKDEIANAIYEVIKAAWEAFLELLWGLISADPEEEPPLVGSLRALGESIEEFVKTVKPLIEWIWDEVVEPAIEYLVNTGIPNTIDKISASIGLLSTAIGGLYDVLNGDVSLSGWFSDLNQSGSDFLKLFRGSDGVDKAASDFSDRIDSLANSADEAEKPVSTLFDLLKGAAERYKDGVLRSMFPFYDTLRTASEIAGVVEQIQSVGDSASESESPVAGLFDELTRPYESGIADAAADMDAFGTAAQQAASKAESAEKPISNLLNKPTSSSASRPAQAKVELDDFGAAAEQAALGAESANKPISDLLDNSSSSQLGRITKSTDALDDFGGTAEQVSSQVKGSTTQVEAAIGGMSSNVQSQLSSVSSSSSTWGVHLIQNLWGGIKSQLGSFFSGISSIAQGIRNFLGFSEPKEGPLSNFHTYGPDMMKLYAEGIESNKGKVLNAVGGLASDISDEMQGGVFEIDAVGTPEIDGALDSFADKVVEGFADLVSRLQAIADSVVFSMPAVAGGGIVPYGVSGGVDGSFYGDNSGNERLLNELIGLVGDFRNAVDRMQWVAQFGDVRAFVKEITKIQKQDERSRG